MKILELSVENFKKVRVVEIRPDRRIVELTGRNGQGKTSVLDAIWFGLKGTKALPTKKASVVRRGSERAKVRIGTEDFVITRTMGKDGAAPTLTLEMKAGVKRDKTPQDFLDDLFGKLTFDPQEFATMDAADQVEELKKTAKVDLDFDAIAAANQKDYDERTNLGREIKGLEARIANVVVLEGLPQEKLDEAAILAKLNDAGEANKRAQATFLARQELGAKVRSATQALDDNESFIAQKEKEIADIERLLEARRKEKKAAENSRKSLALSVGEATAAYNDAPTGEPIDISALTTELQSAQRTNRAIDARQEWNRVRVALTQLKTESARLTRAIEERDEEKRTALAGAKMPVEGLTFDENGVQYKGIPLENLGEGEQLRIAAEIGMAANPTLRVLCIRRGEALDEEGLRILAKLAEDRDFQLWITRVDSSGKVGVVLEDGMVISRDGAAL